MTTTTHNLASIEGQYLLRLQRADYFACKSSLTTANVNNSKHTLQISIICRFMRVIHSTIWKSFELIYLHISNKLKFASKNRCWIIYYRVAHVFFPLGNRFACNIKFKIINTLAWSANKQWSICIYQQFDMCVCCKWQNIQLVVKICLLFNWGKTKSKWKKNTWKALD